MLRHHTPTAIPMSVGGHLNLFVYEGTKRTKRTKRTMIMKASFLVHMTPAMREDTGCNLSHGRPVTYSVNRGYPCTEAHQTHLCELILPNFC